MKPPTLDEVRLEAAKIGLPEVQAEQFYFYFDAKGWMMGKNSPMKKWRSALQTWRLKWQEHQRVDPRAKRHWAEREIERLAREAGL